MRSPAFAARALLTIVLAAANGMSRDVASAGATPQVACASLAGATFANVRITAATPMPTSGSLPAYCKVNGTENGTEHDIEVRLPDDWRDRYVQQGGGGWDGRIPEIGGRNVALTAGAVQAANNGGHRDRSGAVLLNNPQVIERYAYSAILTTAQFGKAVTRAYYGRAPRYSYYEGCSNGGRGAFNAAVNYGAEYDGVIAGAPTLNMVGQIEQWTRTATIQLPNATTLAAINAAAVAKCDRLDGANDGIIANWSACRFDPTVDLPADAGVTPTEAATVKELMADLTLANGKTAYSGFGWGITSSLAEGQGRLGVGHVRNVVLNDPAWSPTGFDPSSFDAKITAVILDRYHFSASPAAVAAFVRSGKKVIAWHGADDGMLSVRDTVRTWQDMTAVAGAAARENSRLYIAPGVNHCRGGPGADTFDLLTPLMAWVEQGTAPGTVAASKLHPDGSTLFTRPMCEYPAYPRYRGTGAVNDAASFECSKP